MNRPASPLLAWSRRDRKLLLGLAAVAYIALMGAAYTDDFWRTWVLPLRGHDSLIICSWIVGIFLALAVSLREQVLGLEEHALHRSTPERARRRSRILGGLVILTMVPLAVAATQLLVEWVTSHFVGAASANNAAELAATVTPGISAFAMTMFALGLGASLPARLLLGACIHLGAYTLLSAAIQTSYAQTTAGLLAASNLTLAAPFLAAAWWQRPRPHDRDLPIDAGVPRIARMLASAFAVLLAFQGLVGARNEALSAYSHASPVVAELDDGRLEMLWNREWPTSQWWRERPDGGREDVERPAASLRPFAAHGARDPFVRPPRFRSGWQSRSAWLQGGRVVFAKRGWSDYRYDVLGKPGDGSAFGPGSEFVQWRRPEPQDAERSGSIYAGNGEEETWLVEPGATKLWRFDRQRVRLESMPLPQGATVVAAAGPFAVRANLAAGGAATFRLTSDGSFDPIDAPTEPAFHQRLRTDGDPLTPHITVTRPGDEPWEHDVELRSVKQYALACAAFALSAVQPPAAALASTVSGHEPRSALKIWPMFQDPLIASGQRPWVLLLCLAVGALCGWAAWRYLARIGAPRGARVTWALFCTLAGPVGVLLTVSLERPRAYRSVPATPPHSPQVLTRRSA